MKSDPPDQLAAPVRRGASARLPTAFGEFTLTSYFDDDTGVEHLALHLGELVPEGGGEVGNAGAGADVDADADADAVLVRVHSECVTGDIFSSLRCDCGPQLHMAMERIAAAGRGVVIYMRGHEGRGIGITEKLRAYTLQDQGLDTVEANLALGHPVDARRFEAAAAILQDLGVRAVRLMSNNPLKLLALQDLGITIVQREPHEIEANAENAAYLGTKRDRLGHWLGG